MSTPNPFIIARRSTGIPNLDVVLGGGLLQRGLTMVLGAPGTGKTVFTQQVASHFSRQGLRTAFFTTLSESTDQLVSQLRTFTFYDEESLGTTLQVLSIQALTQNGLQQLSDILVRIAREQRLDALIIDGFRNILGVNALESETRQFLYDLSAKLNIIGVTLIISNETEARIPKDYVALTLADCIINLQNERLNLRHLRTLEVLKLRGGRHMNGAHSMTITDQGITVYPRLEAQQHPPQPVGTEGYLTFGLPEIDAMLGGGVRSGTNTLIAGTPGTGKTLLGLFFIKEGLQRGEPGLILSFSENEAQLHSKSRAFNLDLEQAIDQKLLAIRTIQPVEFNIDEVAQFLQQALATSVVKRVFIDSVNELDQAAREQGRAPEYLTAFTYLLRSFGVTSYLTQEVRTIISPTLDFSSLPIGILADNLILLRQVEYRGSMERIIAILKMRHQGYNTGICSYTIQADGIKLNETLPQASLTLSGAAQIERNSS